MVNEVLWFIVRNLLGQRRAINWYYKYKDGAITKSLKEPLSPAKRNWLESKSKPRKELMWGLETNGDDFIKKVTKYYKFSDDAEILEIGSGLGRLLKSIIKKKIHFRTYLGTDITKSNVEYLRETFVDSKIRFIEGSAENVVFDNQFDAIISSLMFKHFMPTFELALSNLSKHLKERGMVFFDLDADASNNEDDDQTLTCQYTTRMVKEILQRCGIKLVAFDEVTHVGSHKGLLVIGRK